MRETIWHITIILVIGGAVFFTNLGGSRLWDRDEPRNAGCAAEMMARGDWVVPIFNDELRHQKPVLLYWLVMSAYALFGVDEWTARFWSAALAMGTLLATYGIASRLASRSAALLAAIALATSLMFDVAARAVTPDSLLIFCGTSALLVYVLGTFRQTDDGPQLKVPGRWFPQNRLAVIGMYVLLGLGVLAKGPVGFLLPMAIMGLFMLIQTVPASKGAVADGSRVTWGRRIRHLTLSIIRPFHPVHFLKTLGAMQLVMGVVVVLAVALPWYVLVDGRTGGDFTRLFFVGEHFGRATSTLESHSGGIWFYPLAILVGFFPWSVFWGPVLIGFFADRSSSNAPSDRSRLATCFCLCWVGVQVGAFSLAQTKLPSYVTPCYPALAILTAICLDKLANRQTSLTPQWFYLALGGLVIAGLGISVGVGWATLKFLPEQVWLVGLGLIPLVAGVAMIQLMRMQQTQRLPWVMSGSAFLFCWILFGFGTVSIDQVQQSHLILDVIADDSDVEVAAFGCLESSWVFYGGHPIHELIVDSPGSQVSESRPNFWSPKPRISVEEFVSSHPRAMIITTEELVEALLDRLPDEFAVIQDAEYFLKNKRIYLLGRRPSTNPGSPNRDESPPKQSGTTNEFG